MDFKKLLQPVSVLLAVVVGDQLSKWWVMASFAPHESREVIPGFFSLTYITNTGAAFGLLAGEITIWRQVFFIGVALVALVALYFAYRHFRDAGRLYVVGLGLIGGGALGNVIDRLRFGAVVDFLDFYVQGYHWPAFNVADSAITVGVGLFLIASFLADRKQQS